MDNVACTGNETSLFDCSYNPTHDCGSHEGAGVVCSTSIFLQGGSSSEGNLFVNNMPVCDDDWDNNDATVACRMLG